MAGTAAIFRIDASGDTEVTAAGINQIIEFGTGATNPDAKSFIESAWIHWLEDISTHKNPKKALDKKQDGQLADRELVVTGWFEDPDNAAGIARISTWMKDPKTNASLPNGRFGVRIDDLSTLDINPSVTVAYLLHDAIIEIPPDHPFEANFTLKFWLNGIHP